MITITSVVRLLVRVLVTSIGLFVYYTEKLVDYFLGISRKTEYMRMGRCKRCGVCCKTIVVSLPKRLAFRSWAVSFFKWWHHYRYNFVFVGMDEENLIYECLHLRKDGSCGIYMFRPRLCREYPKLTLHGCPQVYPTCGYYFVKRRRGPSFKEILDKKKVQKRGH